MKIDWAKLRHEWKTFSLSVVAVLVEGYDIFVASNLDYTPIIPEQYRPYVAFGLGVLFLLLRRYQSLASVTTETEIVKTQTVTTVTPIPEEKVV